MIQPGVRHLPVRPRAHHLQIDRKERWDRIRNRDTQKGSLTSGTQIGGAWTPLTVLEDVWDCVLSRRLGHREG
jgi:hypothetical protein